MMTQVKSHDANRDGGSWAVGSDWGGGDGVEILRMGTAINLDRSRLLCVRGSGLAQQ